MMITNTDYLTLLIALAVVMGIACLLDQIITFIPDFIKSVIRRRKQ